MSVVVRPATASELDAVGELTVRAYVADGLLAPDHAYVAELRDARPRAEHGTLLVAVDDPHGRTDGTSAADAPADGPALLGTITLARHGSPLAEVARPGEAEVRMLAVDPRARGRGVAERLVRDVLARAAQDGTTGTALTTLRTMQAAQRLYRRLGFHRAPARDWRFEDIELLVYERSNDSAVDVGHGAPGVA